jgi:hypothetical protein
VKTQQLSRILLEGMIAGAIGYLTVVLVIGTMDLAGGRSLLHTPSLLGQILIGGFGDPTPGIVAAGPVLAFNGAHLLTFLVIGTVVAWLVLEVELHPVIWYGAFFAVLCIVLLSFLVLSLVEEPHSGMLRSSDLIVANALAAVAMGFYLHKAHPGLGKIIEEHGDPESG